MSIARARSIAALSTSTTALLALASALSACSLASLAQGTGATDEAVRAGSGQVRQSVRGFAISGASVSGSLGETPRQGNVLCVTVAANTSLRVTGVSGGGISHWQLAASASPPYGAMVTYWGVVGSAPSEAITASFSGNPAYAELYMVEIEGVAALDTERTTSGDGVTVTVPALQLAGPGEVIVAQTWLQGGAVSHVADHGFVDSFAPQGWGPGIFESYDVLGSASTYTSESYTQPSGAWYSQAVAFKKGAAPPPPPVDAGSPHDAAPPPPADSGPPAADSGSPAVDSGQPVAAHIPAPAGWSYSQLVWDTQFGYGGMGSSPSAPNQGTFSSGGEPAPDTAVGLLNDWNFGVQQEPGAVWSRSGSSPYWGSSQASESGSYASSFSADYSFPGNVFQTSTGGQASLFGAYQPQLFTPSGTGLTLQDHYVGGPSSLPIQSNGSIYYYMWSSGVLNTEGKRFFPFGGATEFYAQVSAKMAGPNNGSWSAIWMLPDQGEGGAGQEIDIQEYNVSGANADAMYSHVQAPVVAIGTGRSATPLCDGYHVYGWHVSSATQTVTVYLDGIQTGSFTGAQVGSKYFFILDAAISSGQQSWETSEGFVTNSNADMAFGIAEVQVFQP